MEPASSPCADCSVGTAPDEFAYHPLDNHDYEYIVGYKIPTKEGEDVLVDNGKLGMFDQLGHRSCRSYRKQNDPTGYEFWRDYLGSPVNVLAPMVWEMLINFQLGTTVLPPLMQLIWLRSSLSCY